MKIEIYGTKYTCDKAIKGIDFVALIKEEIIIANFRGISDFSGYKIIEGEWSYPESTEIELLQSKVTAQDKVIEELMFNIIPEIIGGGIQ